MGFKKGVGQARIPKKAILSYTLECRVRPEVEKGRTSSGTKVWLEFFELNNHLGLQQHVTMEVSLYHFIPQDD